MSIETSGLSQQAPISNPGVSSQPSTGAAPAAQPTSKTAQNSEPAIQGGQSTELSVEKLQEAVEKMNELMQGGNRSLNFSVDDSTEKVVVKVMDTDTKEIVRQIPSEETLKFAEHLEGMLGLLFDDKA